MSRKVLSDDDVRKLLIQIETTDANDDIYFLTTINSDLDYNDEHSFHDNIDTVHNNIESDVNVGVVEPADQSADLIFVKMHANFIIRDLIYEFIDINVK